MLKLLIPRIIILFGFFLISFGTVLDALINAKLVKYLTSICLLCDKKSGVPVSRPIADALTNITRAPKSKQWCLIQQRRLTGFGLLLVNRSSLFMGSPDESSI